MLAQNINPATGEPCHNTVQIIPASCENCPIARFSVTDNCQKCMGKKCMQACKFGAISMTRDKAYIDPEKCNIISHVSFSSLITKYTKAYLFNKYK